MTRNVVLRMTGSQHANIQRHLFPGDGKEAIAIVLCGRRPGKLRHCLSVWKLELIPYEECERSSDSIKWPTDRLVSLLEEAERKGLAVVKIHSHPCGYPAFSNTDDVADGHLFLSLSSWTETDAPHASAVMLPDGSLFGRAFDGAGECHPLELITVCGESLSFWFGDEPPPLAAFTDRHAQVLGEDTTSLMSRLRCAIVGCSGTGSLTIEQLYRLNVMSLVLVDPEGVGVENLNRIVNSTTADAEHDRPKVHVMDGAVRRSGLPTEVIPIHSDLCLAETLMQVAECDVVFGCIDNAYARHVLNKLCSTYLIPYIDMGIRLRADGESGIEHVTGGVHYLQPDGSSLLSRRVYTMEDVQGAALKATDPAEYARRSKEGYIAGADTSRAAVISVNMIFSGLAVFELLSRLHPIRDEGNADFAGQRLSLSHRIWDNSSDGERCSTVTRFAGRGDMDPLLGIPEFSTSQEAGRCSS
jgi:hypothetical protein